MGGEQQLGGAVEVARGRGLPGDLGGRQELDQALVLHGLGRHLDLDRARPSRAELPRRLANRGGHVGHREDPPPPLGDRGDAVLLIVDLVQEPDVPADAVAGDLTGEHQHRGGGGVRGGEAGQCIEKPWSGHHQRGAKVAARARVAVRHEAGGLLVARGDEADARLLPQGGHHAVELHAGQPEDHPHALVVERAHERLAAGHGCRRHGRCLLPAAPQGASMAPAWASSSMSRSL